MIATACQHCGADVSGVAQTACETYDHVEIPDIEPDVTRVTLHGGVCPCSARRRAITALEAIRLTLAGTPLATAP